MHFDHLRLNDAKGIVPFERLLTQLRVPSKNEPSFKRWHLIITSTYFYIFDFVTLYCFSHSWHIYRWLLGTHFLIIKIIRQILIKHSKHDTFCHEMKLSSVRLVSDFFINLFLRWSYRICNEATFFYLISFPQRSALLNPCAY